MEHQAPVSAVDVVQRDVAMLDAPGELAGAQLLPCLVGERGDFVSMAGQVRRDRPQRLVEQVIQVEGPPRVAGAEARASLMEAADEAAEVLVERFTGGRLRF